MGIDDHTSGSNLTNTAFSSKAARTGISWNRKNKSSFNAPNTLYMPQQSTGQGSRKGNQHKRTKTVTPKQLGPGNWKTIDPPCFNSAFI